MPSIADVAKMAGVSPATVSRYLNHRSGHMTAQTAERIREAIERLGYCPSTLAQSLRNKTTNMVGVVAHDMTNPFFQKMVRGMEEELDRAGIQLLLCSSHMDPERELRCIQMLNQRQVDGILLMGLNQRIMPQLKMDSRAPIVLLEQNALSGDYDSLQIDNRQGAREAVEYLIARGYQRIAHVRGPENAAPAKERYDAYCEVLQEHGRAVCEALVFQGTYHLESGYMAMDAFFSQPDPPDAVFCSNDVMAFGALRYAAEHGIRVPEQVAVVGYDDIEMAPLITPALTTVQQPVLQLARMAAQILMQRMQIGYSEEQPAKSILLKPQLIVRDSA